MKICWSFLDSVLEKKKAFNGSIADPVLKRKKQVPGWYSVGKAPDKHPKTPRGNHHKVYFEALDLFPSRNMTSFQPQYDVV